MVELLLYTQGVGGSNPSLRTNPPRPNETGQRTCEHPTVMLGLRRAKRVLLLDDDAAIRRLASAILRSAGFRVDVVDQGSLAIEKLASGAYDAILLDLMMPTEGGLTVVRYLREHRPALLQRALLFTSTPESVVRNIEREVAGLVHKPFTRDQLVEAVTRVAK